MWPPVPHCTCRVSQPHQRISEDQVIGSVNQASLRIYKQQPELLIINLSKNILRRHWPDNLLTFPEDKTRENVFGLYHEGFQLDLGLENTERSNQERRDVQSSFLELFFFLMGSSHVRKMCFSADTGKTHGIIQAKGKLFSGEAPPCSE